MARSFDEIQKNQVKLIVNKQRTASIDISVEPESGLIVFKSIGLVPAEVAGKAIRDHFPRHKVPDAIWDLRDADLSEMNFDSFMKIAREVKATKQFRGPNPRTVFVTNEDQEQTLLKLYQEISRILGTKITYKTVRSVEEARAWLGIKPQS